MILPLKSNSSIIALILSVSLQFGTFSKAGPTQEQMDGTSFSMSHHGYSYDSATDSVQKKVCIFAMCFDANTVSCLCHLTLFHVLLR